MAKIYIDRANGLEYAVLHMAGVGAYKAWRRRVGSEDAWRRVAPLPWRDTPEAAQADLDKLACKHGWEAMTV